ncbi:MAG: hypothetical protein U0992_04115 [Planctomycetaceae bacterium]
MAFPVTVGARSNAVEFKTNSGGLNKQVGPGENFLIGTHDGSITVHQAGSPSFGQVRAADFYLNTDTSTPEFEANAPNGPSAMDPNTQPAPVPLTDLDLCHPQDTEFHTDRTLNDLTLFAPAGALDVGLGTKLVGVADPSKVETKTSFVLVLERQLNPHAAGVLQKDPWVEVDRMYVRSADFAPATNADISNPLTTPLRNMHSGERRQPLSLRNSTNESAIYTITPPAPAPAPPPPDPPQMGNVVWEYRYEQHSDGTMQNHTLDSQSSKHGPNSQQSTPFDVWQPHFDRDFTSVYDLLSVPVISPERLIEQLTNASGKLSGKYTSVNPVITGEVASVAGQYFRNPDGDANDNNAIDGWETPNRWYRLLEFVEIPPRANDTIRDSQSLRRRTEARINLNTLRQEPVLAGLVDDAGRDNLGNDVGQLATLSNPARPTQDRHDTGGPPTGFVRNWFDQLLIARDGLDYFTGLAGLAMPNVLNTSGSPMPGLPLPGVPGAMPFRSMAYLDPQPNIDPNTMTSPPDLLENQLQNTLLRSHLTTTGLGLFDARSSADAQPSNNVVDYYTTNRLLSKIANNTTNRSHVFAMWVGYELFEAHQPNAAANPDVVQIGSKITDLPGHRDFVVVDMTRLEEAFVDDPNDTDVVTGKPLPGRFDWRKFIIYRKRIK